jgi:hypothetical protein
MARMIYVYLWKDLEGGGIKTHPIACSNKRVLAEQSHMGYDNIMRIFTRQGRRYYEDREHVIVKIYESDILRGRQKIKVRGKRFGDSGD